MSKDFYNILWVSKTATQDEIKKLDYEINQMVYKIYELTVDEIKIIENS